MQFQVLFNAHLQSIPTEHEEIQWASEHFTVYLINGDNQTDYQSPQVRGVSFPFTELAECQTQQHSGKH